jgi:Poly-beta-hydroxybutyrate polymerase (PhaC) N-terminus
VPSNFLLTNLEILEHTVSKGGMNLVTGFQNLVEDWERAISGKKPVGLVEGNPDLRFLTLVKELASRSRHKVNMAEQGPQPPAFMCGRKEAAGRPKALPSRG